MKGMTEAEVLAVSHNIPSVLKECPLCGGGHLEEVVACFHCWECDYMECCDEGGYYDAQRAAMREKEVRE